MNKSAAVTITVLRLSLGWFMFFDGLQILSTPGWTASKFLLGAKTFPALYAWLAQPVNIWWVDPLNVWGIILIGAALLLGVGVRPAAWAGVAMMILYYFPHNAFPIVPHGYIVEEHIIYAVAFALIAVLPAAQSFGLGAYVRKTPLGRMPLVRWFI